MVETSRHGIGKIAKVGIVIVVIFVALIALGASVAPKGSTTTSQTTTSSAAQQSSQTSPASSTSAPSTTESSSSTASSGSSGPLAIVISQAITDPPDAQASSSVYIYDVTLTNNGQTSYLIDEFYFSLISASNTVYNPTIALAIQQSLPSLSLAQGQKATGQIAFQIPNTETPAKLEYHIPLSINEFVTNLPTPSSAVSEPNLEINTNVEGSTNAFGVQDLNAFATIENQTLYFYTGQVIAIQVQLSAFTGSTVSVNSITCNTTGLSISQIAPSLPIMVNGNNNGNGVDVTVYLVAPATSFSGMIMLNVTETG